LIEVAGLLLLSNLFDRGIKTTSSSGSSSNTDNENMIIVKTFKKMIKMMTRHEFYSSLVNDQEKYTSPLIYTMGAASPVCYMSTPEHSESRRLLEKVLQLKLAMQFDMPFHYVFRIAITYFKSKREHRKR
jgi:hypothetical protein